MINRLLTALGTAAVLTSGPLAAIDRGDAEAGRELAENQCMACHAVDGSHSNPEWPRLSGQYADYLLHSLKAYQDGSRENAVMQGQVEDLSLQDLRDLAAFYSGQDGELYVPKKR